jgi:hypothetical protein
LLNKKDPCVGVVEAVGCFTCFNLKRDIKNGTVVFHVDIRNDSNDTIKRNVQFTITAAASLTSVPIGSFKTPTPLEFAPREIKHVDQEVKTPEAMNLEDPAVKDIYFYDVTVTD